jgi:hypothetical protein
VLTKADDSLVDNSKRITRENSRSLTIAIAQTDPKLRGSCPFHDFFGENSGGIFDGISGTQPEIIK